MDRSADIDAKYEAFYSERLASKVYPTELVVRIFLAKYPGLAFEKPAPQSKILDVAFGDGRNTTFLCDQGFDVYGIEITQGIVDQTAARLKRNGQSADLRVGRNIDIPFEADTFDAILACSCCYYCDEGATMRDNLAEYCRVMRSGAWLIASVADASSFIFDGADKLEDGSFRIAKDHYGNREGYRLHGFESKEELIKYFSPYFRNFSLGHSSKDYFGITEELFWVVCQKR